MRERSTWESVIAVAMERDDPMGTAIEAMRVAQEFPVHTRHSYEIAEAGWCKDVVPQIDDMVQHVRHTVPADLMAAELLEERGPLLVVQVALVVVHVIRCRTRSPRRRSTVPGRSLQSCTGAREKSTPRPGARRRPGLNAHRKQHRTTSANPSLSWTTGPSWASSSPRSLPTGGMGRARELGALRDDWMQRAALVQSYREASRRH
jgi:hypothetical protein